MGKLKELRELNRMTQPDLARLLNVAQATVSKWDNGSSMPDASKAIELSRLYKVSLDEIYENPYAPVRVDVATLTMPQKRILELLARIADEADQYEAVGMFRQSIEYFTRKK
jgi:transcriptional regulator with XRE-family HTH domain